MSIRASFGFRASVWLAGLFIIRGIKSRTFENKAGSATNQFFELFTAFRAFGFRLSGNTLQNFEFMFAG
jgi:hypothetical protein